MKFERGTVADSLYIQFSDQPISHSIEVSEDIVLDVDKDNNVLGLDIQHVKEVVEEYKQSQESLSPPSFKLQLVPA